MLHAIRISVLKKKHEEIPETEMIAMPFESRDPTTCKCSRLVRSIRKKTDKLGKEHPTGTNSTVVEKKSKV